ncbi:hypothetical protein PDESU_03467 [Pontiella desulfatans]|uniref:Outer membrane protein beta-barrel domain-containing protein n=1 Tax=Pontiella desulfatans TaxID=2750659 RepID=A0A6C2U505_PONDE|nr:hypothetical protein [Pontiella desulfatans]VGO14897.1 hypothetical protein PDESU_03467 [Pontiella desulfatans]
MKKIITTTIAAGLIAGVAMAEVGVTMDFASAYVFRGVTLSDKASFQPGIEASGFGLAEEYGAVSVGAWGACDLGDSYTGASSSTFQETDWYATYSLPSFVDGLDLYVGYCEYTYGAGSSDKEANVGVGYAIGDASLGMTYYQGVGGVIGSSAYGEFSAGYDIAATEELGVSLGARVGYADPSGGKSGFADYDLSVGVGYALGEVWSVGASIAYIGQIDDKVLGDAYYETKDEDGDGEEDGWQLGYDVDVVAMLSIGASF